MSACFLLDLVTASFVVLACPSYLPRFASLGPWPYCVVYLQVPDLHPSRVNLVILGRRFQTVVHTGEARTNLPYRRQLGEIATGTCDSSSHHFDMAARTEQRYQRDVVMHEVCAFITRSEKLPRLCKRSSHEISKRRALVGVRSLSCLQ